MIFEAKLCVGMSKENNYTHTQNIVYLNDTVIYRNYAEQKIRVVFVL